MWWTLVLSTALAAEPEGWEWHGDVGAEVDALPHGVFTLGTRKGPWSFELQTTALDARFTPTFEDGKAWVGLRLEPGTAGNFFSRWIDGRPAPEANVLAFSGGIDAGGQAYLPYGLYMGLQGFLHGWGFVGFPDGAEPPDPRLVGRVEASLGWWRPYLHLWMVAGATMTPDAPVSPHLRAELVTAMPWIVRPRIEVRAGFAEHTDDIWKTRVGGLNPFVVPLAGAGWGEFWVEDYAAFRVGPEVGQARWRTSLVTDAVWMDGDWAVGFAASGRYDNRGRWVEVALGVAPWLPRDTFVAMAGWVRVGIDWGHGWGPRTP